MWNFWCLKNERPCAYSSLRGRTNDGWLWEHEIRIDIKWLSILHYEWANRWAIRAHKSRGQKKQSKEVHLNSNFPCIFSVFHLHAVMCTSVAAHFATQRALDDAFTNTNQTFAFHEINYNALTRIYLLMRPSTTPWTQHPLSSPLLLPLVLPYSIQ